MDSRNLRQGDHPKRRRRRATRPPISAKLVLDEQAKGNIGTISRDLYEDLFGKTLDLKDPQDAVRHVAIAPWRPLNPTLEEDCSWTILPVTLQSAVGQPSAISFPASSHSLQSFAAALQASKNEAKSREHLEVLVLDVKPLNLDTVFVKVDGEALRKHEEVQKKFRGGFPSSVQSGFSGKGKGKATAARISPTASPAECNADKGLQTRLVTAIRSSLSQPHVVHCNDQLPMPLPAHPITHVPFPPIKISICEPVDQGLMHSSTRIVIDMNYRDHSHRQHQLPHTPTEPLQKMAEEAEDAMAEQFFSAAEGDGTPDGLLNGSENTDEQQSTTDASDEDESSSDDAENMISLNSPTLPTQASGIMSSRTSATPRPLGGMKRSGVNTPGSIFSNYTATTTRQGMTGRQFQLKALTTRIPDSILHPQPINDEDDEARVFVDLKVLAKLGCFSGDWVKLVVAPKASDGNDRLWSLGAFGGDEAENFRPVKIYGLSETQHDSSIQYPKTDFARRFSAGSFFPSSRPKPNAYVSPILFANLGQPTTVAISAISMNQSVDRRFSRSKLPSAAAPPTAKDITLLRVITPTFNERTSFGGTFAYLKHHFATRRRLLRAGDLIAIRVDLAVTKMFLNATATAEAETDLEELLAGNKSTGLASERSTAVAWFRVGHLTGTILDENQNTLDPELWGGVVTFEPMVSRMSQNGSDTRRLPSLLEVPWSIYLGVKRCPKPLTAAMPIQTLESFRKPYIGPVRRRLRELLTSTTTPRAIHLGMQPIVILLHSTQRGVGKSHLVSAACADIGLHVFPIDSYDIITAGQGGDDVKTLGALASRIERAMTCGIEFTVPIIQHAEALTSDRVASQLKGYIQELRALIITTTELGKIPESLRSLVTHELEISAPDENDREGILSEIVNDRAIRLAYDVELAAVAVKTAALVAGDLSDVIERALVARKERLRTMSADNKTLTRDILVSGGSSARCIIKADFDVAVDAARKNFADSIGAPKIPNVSWDDVGGLSNVKDAVMETIQLPLERPDLFAKGMKKRSGILFYGPPGTGKTLLAKAIATEFSLNFFSVKGPELLNMYIGESEANVRRVFQRARDARPCVVFFDELDSVAPKRGNQGDSGGVMDRIVSQLLAELDGMSDGDGGGGGVFVIGATNRPDLLDQALIRPGRFDKMLYLGVSDTHEKQLTILEALTRKFTLHPQMSLHNVAQSLPFTYTGADLYALCSDAMLKAITRQASAVDSKIKSMSNPVTTAYFFDHLATQEDIAVMVTEEDFFAAQRELVGSVRYVETNAQNLPWSYTDFLIVPKSYSITNGCGRLSKEHHNRLNRAAISRQL